MGDYEPLKCIMTNSRCYKESKPMEVKGICFCSFSMGYSRLRRFVQPSDDDPNYEQLFKIIGKNQRDNDYNHNMTQTGFTFWIGRFEQDSVGVVQTLPDNYRGWGCGQGKKGSGNDGWIQIQVLHQHPELEVGYDYKVYTQAIHNSMVVLSEYLCNKFNIDPLGTAKCGSVSVPTITTRTEMYDLELAYTANYIGDWFLNGLTLDGFRHKVKENMQ